MVLFILRRIASGLALLLAVSALTFFLLYFSATSIARNILGDSATPEQVVQKEIELGLDQPIIGRYFSWLGHALQGDLGISWFTSQPVMGTVSDRLPVTLTLVIVTVLIVAVLATFIGMAAAVRRGWLDRALQIVSISGAAIPQFVLAIVLVTVFAINLKLLPATGFVPWTEGSGAWLASIILPVAALAISAVASTAQQVRSATINVLSKDYVRTLRSRGLTPPQLLIRHVLRAASPAGLTVLSLQFIAMLGGVVVVEQIFALPGMGFLGLQSTIQGDMPVLMGVVIYIVLIVVIVNLLVDLAIGWLNPKARLS